MYVVCEMRDLPNDVVLSAGSLYTSAVQGDHNLSVRLPSLPTPNDVHGRS